MVDFSTAVELEPAGEHRWRARLTSAALGGQAAAEVAGPGRPLRTLDVAFVAPLPPGEVVLEAEVLGEGKSTIQVEVSVYAGGPGGRVLGCRVFAVAGASRPSGVRVEPAPAVRQAGDPAGQGAELPYVPGVSPAFVQHMEYRWCSPFWPFSSSGPEGALTDGWVRHRTPAEGLPALIGLLDAWPPALLPMFSTPAPASTVRWSIHFAGADAEGRPRVTEAGAGKQWVWNELRTVQAGDGYATTYASTYDADGRLLAWSEQLIAVYDKPASPPA